MSLHTLIYGLEQLATGKLSHTLLPPNVLHKYLEKALREVRIHHPQFVPLYTELHHYYESDMNSYTNDETHIYLQIPVFFTAKKPATTRSLSTSYGASTIRLGYICR